MKLVKCPNCSTENQTDLKIEVKCIKCDYTIKINNEVIIESDKPKKVNLNEKI